VTNEENTAQDKNMAAPSTAEKMSEAYLIYSEWGPARATPRAERLATCFPDETAVLRAAWIEKFARVDAEIWRIAAEMHYMKGRLGVWYSC
jgi:hypothetical protein